MPNQSKGNPEPQKGEQAVMLANDHKFKSLTQLAKDNEKTWDNTMFMAVRGAGGYHGAAVNFDLTLTECNQACPEKALELKPQQEEKVVDNILEI